MFLQGGGGRPDTFCVLRSSGSAAERAQGDGGSCPATVLVRPGGRFSCEKEAGHEGLHEARMAGEWEAVMWPDGATVVAAPGSWRRRRR